MSKIFKTKEKLYKRPEKTTLCSTLPSVAFNKYKGYTAVPAILIMDSKGNVLTSQISQEN